MHAEYNHLISLDSVSYACFLLLSIVATPEVVFKYCLPLANWEFSPKTKNIFKIFCCDNTILNQKSSLPPPHLQSMGEACNSRFLGQANNLNFWSDVTFMVISFSTRLLKGCSISEWSTFFGKNNVRILKQIVWEIQKWHLKILADSCRLIGSWVIDENNILHFWTN